MVLDPGLAFRFTTIVTLTHRNHVFDVAGRADYRARLGQRHLDHYFRRDCSRFAECVGQFVWFGAARVRWNAFSAILICPGRSCVTYFVVFIERGQRKILVNYAKRQVGNKIYGGQSSHLPLKLNMAGVIPPIFASSIILFPATIAGWFIAGGDTLIR